jgi:cellulose synthase/poly-beta-1,6-N-acetylglucosamine synthase-like glycosyltransferase
MTILADILLTVAALPALAAALYLAGLAMLARRHGPVAAPPPQLRFDVIVPAHNEETEIGETVRSLRAMAYPAELFRVLVVADNCTDGTAAQAASAGAEVLVRTDTEHRGKGYALAYAFARILSDGRADAVVVVDADTLVSPNLLVAFAARFAAGEMVVQADYGVRNHGSSWRTRLMTIALAAFHGVRSIARERLGLSCGLRGNGMGFTKAVLAAHPPQAFSIVEDLEYGIHLGYAGIRAAYVHEARVLGHMAVTENASRSQRRRWERGRQALVRAHVPGLIRAAWRRRSAMLLDLAIDLLVPPIGTLVLVSGAGLFAALIAAFTVGSTVAPWVWGLALLGIVAHVLRGWSLSGVGPRGLLDLLWAPVYVLWKLTLRFSDKGRAPKEWVRTKREVHS